jgi:hypothetical protein
MAVEDGSHMYEKRLRQANHSRRFQIQERDGAWDVRSMEDNRIVTEARYDDWHRVERARMTFGIAIRALEDEGWVSDPEPHSTNR